MSRSIPQTLPAFLSFESRSCNTLLLCNPHPADINLRNKFFSCIRRHHILGTLLSMAKSGAKDRQQPIEFKLEEAIEKYNESRPKAKHLTLYKLQQLTGISNSTTWRHKRGKSNGIDWRTL